jgi:hypothetical protein
MTFDEALVAELAHSGVLERMGPWIDAHLKPWVEWRTVETQKMWLGMVQMTHAIAERAEQNFPSKAYGPYLAARGAPPFLASGLASLTLSGGKRQAREAKWVAPVVEAIRFLSRGDRQKRAILSRAKLVLAASKETSIVDELFRKAGLHEGEFLRLLQTLVDGGAIDRECIKTIAAAVVLSVRRARGPKITAPSAAHEQLLEMNASFGLRAGYTKSGSDGEYTDPETQATRQEFDDRDFDPRPAHRRVKRRGLVNTCSSRSPIR